MNRQLAIVPVKPKVCHGCNEDIQGRYVNAMCKFWHPDHFKCTECQTAIGMNRYLEKNGKPYCEPDYHKLFTPNCALCGEPVKANKIVKALKKTFHKECFCCTLCGQGFRGEGYHEHEGKPYCTKDYKANFAPKCNECNRHIMDKCVSALEAKWHQDCFNCIECRIPVANKSFYARDGKPACSKCVTGMDEDDEGEIIPK
jgi:paxillin